MNLPEFSPAKKPNPTVRIGVAAGILFVVVSVVLVLSRSSTQTPATAADKVVEGLTQDAGQNCVVFVSMDDVSDEAAAKLAVVALAERVEAFDLPPSATLKGHSEAYFKFTNADGQTGYVVVAAAEICQARTSAPGSGS